MPKYLSIIATVARCVYMSPQVYRLLHQHELRVPLTTVKIYLDTDGVEEAFVYPTDAGDLADREVVHEGFDRVGREVEHELAVWLILSCR